MRMVRSFEQILTESRKTYPFKIGVAGELPEDFTDKLETSLKKFGLKNLSTGKKTPIQERPLDFPQLQNMEVTYFDVELEYPTTVQVLQEYVGKCCAIHQSCIIVRNPNEPQERYQEEDKEETVYEPKLTNPDLGGESAQESVGQNRIMELLKELEIARKERGHNPAEAAPTGSSKDIGDAENTTSAIGN